MCYVAFRICHCFAYSGGSRTRLEPRVIAVVSNSRRNPVRRLTDGSFCASGCAEAVSVLTIPVSVVVTTTQLIVNYLTFWTAALIIIGKLAVLCETSNALIAGYVTTYNQRGPDTVRIRNVVVEVDGAPVSGAAADIQRDCVRAWIEGDLSQRVISLGSNLIKEQFYRYPEVWTAHSCW